MSDDRKAVILGRLQRFNTVTPRPQAWVRSACCARAGARAAWTLAPHLGHLQGQGAACVPLTSVWPVLHTRRPSPSWTPANASHVFTE